MKKIILFLGLVLLIGCFNSERGKKTHQVQQVRGASAVERGNTFRAFHQTDGPYTFKGHQYYMVEVTSGMGWTLVEDPECPRCQRIQEGILRKVLAHSVQR